MKDDSETNSLIRKRQARLKKTMARKLATGAAGLVITLSPAAGAVTESDQNELSTRDVSKRLAKVQSSWSSCQDGDTQARPGSSKQKAERLVQWRNGWDDWRNGWDDWRNYRSY